MSKLRIAEPVEPTPRAPMTKARRFRIWFAHGGRCGVASCRVKVPLDWTCMDHALQLWMHGEDEDHNLRPLCPACRKIKDAQDATDRAKVRGMQAYHLGTKPPSKRPLKSGRKLQGRKFSTRTRSPFLKGVGRGNV